MILTRDADDDAKGMKHVWQKKSFGKGAVGFGRLEHLPNSFFVSGKVLETSILRRQALTQ